MSGVSFSRCSLSLLECYIHVHARARSFSLPLPSPPLSFCRSPFSLFLPSLPFSPSSPLSLSLPVSSPFSHPTTGDGIYRTTSNNNTYTGTHTHTHTLTRTHTHTRKPKHLHLKQWYLTIQYAWYDCFTRGRKCFVRVTHDSFIRGHNSFICITRYHSTLSYMWHDVTASYVDMTPSYVWQHSLCVQRHFK